MSLILQVMEWRSGKRLMCFSMPKWIKMVVKEQESLLARRVTDVT
jgi:hypothetical protein